jgi:predicted SprT family Zn-dependent metalloprotease
MLQFSLQFSNSKDTLEDCLEKMTGKSVSLTITDNSTSLLSIRTKGNLVSVRMHWMFLNADDEVIREIASFIKTRKCRTPLVRKFISENQTCLKKREQNSRRPGIHTKGRFHNLREIFDDLNNKYFGGTIIASISWGKGNARRAVRNRTLGSYCGHTDIIRINPVLGRRNVPRYFIRYVVYHEMLHSTVEEEMKNSRRSVHTSEFRKLERLFKDYGKAVSWEKRLMQKSDSAEELKG